MDKEKVDLLEKIRQQFERAPYPNTPLEKSPQNDSYLLYIHNVVTAYYLRNKKIIETDGKIILDAGCGSGYKSLVLAIANPGAKIIGIDFSGESVNLAEQRLRYHGIDRAEFYQLALEDLPQLNLKFDYINIDDVLYLLPDLIRGLTTLKNVLNPKGIIRANLHSSLQRRLIYQSQAFFKKLGFLDKNPTEVEVELVREMMNSLKNEVLIKQSTWKPNFNEDEERVLMNYLFQGDRGYTISEMFAALKAADLEFIRMVNWQEWELLNLFKQPDNLSTFLGMNLSEIAVAEQLHLFELLHPVHRLLDFWCGHLQQTESSSPVSDWSLADWQTARVHLHPQLRTAQVKASLIECIANQIPFEISRYLPLPSTARMAIASILAACLLPLWEGSQPVISLVQGYLKLRPLNPVTLEPVSEEAAWGEVQELLKQLESRLYVFLEQAA